MIFIVNWYLICQFKTWNAFYQSCLLVLTSSLIHEHREIIVGTARVYLRINSIRGASWHKPWMSSRILSDFQRLTSKTRWFCRLNLVDVIVLDIEISHSVGPFVLHGSNIISLSYLFFGFCLTSTIANIHRMFPNNNPKWRI